MAGPTLAQTTAPSPAPTTTIRVADGTDGDFDGSLLSLLGLAGLTSLWMCR
jgi:hypothetical protein